MNYELKTCPFCGKPPITRVAAVRGLAADEIAVEIACYPCEIKQRKTIQQYDDFQKLEKAKSEVIAKWNRRAEDGKVDLCRQVERTDLRCDQQRD